METCIAFKDWLFVTVPEDGNGFTMYENYISFYEGQRSFQTMRDIRLPSGSYQIIGKWDAIDWGGLVDVRKGMAIRPYFGYVDYGSDVAVCLTSAESGHSLLRSLGMEPETTLVLKKNDV